MKTVAIIIARMGSTRLPGKVLKPLGDWGGVVLDWVVRAAQLAPGVDETWVATSTDPRDDAIVGWCWNQDVRVFRGSEDDVLDRFYQCAKEAHAHVAVRLTGDCPLLDPQVIGGVVALLARDDLSYAQNVSPATWPDGLDCEAITIDALQDAATFAKRQTDRDCVTQYIERRQNQFPSASFICPLPYLHKERWVLDTAEDYEFCRQVAQHLGGLPPSYLEILRVLDTEPDLRALNSVWKRNERFKAALSVEHIGTRPTAESATYLARALKVIPYGAHTYSRSHVAYGRNAPLFLTHGDGGRCFDVDGNDYVDMVMGLGAVAVGHRHPDVDWAIREQLTCGTSMSLATTLEERAATHLLDTIHLKNNMVMFGKNGTDATTGAVRLARAFTRYEHVVVCGGYHGWNDWSLDDSRSHGIPEQQNVSRTEFGTDAALVIPGCTAAVIVEPETNLEFLRALRKRCDDNGSLLIFDEVLTFGRYPEWTAAHHHRIMPDISCFGKALANGMPLSAIVARPEIMRLMAPQARAGQHVAHRASDEVRNIFWSATGWGDPLALAAMMATLTVLSRGETMAQMEVDRISVRNAISTIIAINRMEEFMLIGDLPFFRISFRGKRSRDLQTRWRHLMAQHGVLIYSGHAICAMHDDNDFRRLLNAYEDVCARLRAELDTDSLPKHEEEAGQATIMRR